MTGWTQDGVQRLCKLPHDDIRSVLTSLACHDQPTAIRTKFDETIDAPVLHLPQQLGEVVLGEDFTDRDWVRAVLIVADAACMWIARKVG